MATAPLPAIHFFRPGRHTALSGKAIEFSAADLAAAAAAYDPAKWPAPIVVGHPALDAPAYGWVAKIEDRDGELYAEPDQVEAQFAELVREGRYKKVSAAWFTPAHPNNPVPGGYYLKHLGFLGAAAPSVAGLKPVAFAAEADDLVIEFGELNGPHAALPPEGAGRRTWGAPAFGAADAWGVKRVFRALREWLIEKDGAEVADRIVPDYSIEGLELAPESIPAPAPLYASPTEPPDGDKGDLMSQEDKDRLAALEAENLTLKAQMAEAARLKRHAEHAAFAAGLVKDGRLTPALRDVTVAVLDTVAGLPEPPQFGEGDAAAPLVEALRAALAAAPVVVDFAERSAPDGNEARDVAEFSADDWASQIDAYVAEHQCSTAQAVAAIRAGKRASHK